MNKELGHFARTIFTQKYAHRRPDGQMETWADCARRVVGAVMAPHAPRKASVVEELVVARKLLPAGRYLYCAGRRYHLTNNCFLFAAEDSREGWADLMRKVTSALMTGGGIGIVYSKVRPAERLVAGMGGVSSGPIALAEMVNEVGRRVRQGGSRRSAIWAGLHWNHADIHAYVRLKDWSAWLVEQKAKDFNAAAPMDGTNISVILDDEFFRAYHDTRHSQHTLAQQVYWSVVRSMAKTGEPGFSVDVGDHAGEHLRNACTEVVSRTDSDVCNLASLNLARFQTLDEFAAAISPAVGFLLCNTRYSDLPLEEMKRVRYMNRRLGLGLMGMHEWLLRRGKPYGKDEELGRWLQVYPEQSDLAAKQWAKKLGVNVPIAVRAIAPTGTISIIAETTSGIEPIFATAYKRRYLKGDCWHAQYVVDAAAQRIIDAGVDPDAIEDAYDLAADVERRIAFQSFVQRYVDQGISSTINLPAWGSRNNNESTVTRFGNTLLHYLPRLRGVTSYPDGSRGGQPLTKVSYRDAVSRVGVEFAETGNESACAGGVCGV